MAGKIPPQFMKGGGKSPAKPVGKPNPFAAKGAAGDMAMDRKMGVKPGSPRDMAMDRKAGVKDDPMAYKKGGKVMAKGKC